MAKQYNIIYADPPWHFKTWSKKGTGRSADKHYKTMPLAVLKQMPVHRLAAPQCVLLMWSTFPLLQQTIELGVAWGFTYKTVAFTWIKKNKKKDTLFMGQGYYTRSNAEIVLLFTTGKPLPRISRKVEQVLFSRIMQHSQKPDEIRQRIVKLFGDVPRLEMFARSRSGIFPDDEYKGWDTFGDEVNNSITLPPIE